MKYRTERDSLGKLKIPSNAYYGIFSERAKNNFRISGNKAPREFIKSLGILKKACAAANIKLGNLNRRLGNAIVYGAEKVINGDMDDQFVVDIFQAGAGTPFNMNSNEVIANLAIKRLGGKLGNYSVIHPNNHVNMSQSSNNVIPSAIKMTLLYLLGNLLKELELTFKMFQRKALKYKKTVKSGRTHLQDAVPITYGQVFGSYATSLKKIHGRIFGSRISMLELGIGGTAVGTGVNAHPDFSREVIKELRRCTGFSFKESKDKVSITWDMLPFMDVSSALRELASDLIKISTDLIILNSGPRTGIGEIILPEVEPGSSIMPGKINPSVPECLIMICFNVLGNDFAVSESAKAGNLELNTMTPLILYSLTESIERLTNGLSMFRNLCIKGLKVNKERTKDLLERNLSLATALNPYLGYEVVAEIVKICLKENKGLKDVLIERKILTDRDFEYLLSHKRVVRTRKVNAALQEKIKKNRYYMRFKKSISKKVIK